MPWRQQFRARGELGLLPPPLAGEGWGGGEQARIFLHAPSLSLQPKSDLSDFGQFICGRARVNPSSAASGEGDDVARSVFMGPRLRGDDSPIHCPSLVD